MEGYGINLDVPADVSEDGVRWLRGALKFALRRHRIRARLMPADDQHVIDHHVRKEPKDGDVNELEKEESDVATSAQRTSRNRPFARRQKVTDAR